MTEAEGIIKFQLRYRPGKPPPAARLHRLNAWRTILHRLGLIGCRPDRYGGLDFGNVSLRANGSKIDRIPNAFWITGTQTSHIERLKPIHYTTVLRCIPDKNRVTACGPIKPSSEAMTHGMLYQQSRHVHCVVHVHCRTLWSQAQVLQIPVTQATAAYGTPALAEEVKVLLSGQLDPEEGIFAMGGHPDGVIAFARSIDTAVLLILRSLASALALGGDWN